MYFYWYLFLVKIILLIVLADSLRDTYYIVNINKNDTKNENNIGEV